MAYKPILTVDVEWEGAVFSFRSPDTAWSRVTAIGTRLRAAGLTAEEIDANPPHELLEALADMFVEGVFAWDGVMGEKAPLACNSPNRRAIPYQHKIEVAQLYLVQCEELQAKNALSADAPTDTTGTDEPTESSSSPTSKPASDTPPKPEAEE